MSEPTELVEEAAAVRSDAFVEVSYDDRIPNNVDLSDDRQLQRALETWQPNYVDWWKEMGPEGFQEAEVYLRTAVGVDPERLGQVRLRQDARVPLGHPAGAQGRRPHDPLRPPQGPAGLAGSAG
jgi:hypothetical protein